MSWGLSSCSIVLWIMTDGLELLLYSHILGSEWKRIHSLVSAAIPKIQRLLELAWRIARIPSTLLYLSSKIVMQACQTAPFPEVKVDVVFHPFHLPSIIYMYGNDYNSSLTRLMFSMSCSGSALTLAHPYFSSTLMRYSSFCSGAVDAFSP